MVRITDFVTISDVNVTLATDGSKEESQVFALPIDAPRFSAILAFRVLPNSGTNLFFVAELNGVNVFQATLVSAPTAFRTVHEIIEAKDPAILKGGLNELKLKLTGGSGSVVFSDPVLWYKHDV